MLNRKSVYALHALHRMALESGERFSTARLAELTHSPRRFLEQILRELREAELLHSEPGRNGGYQLALPADQISLADILRVVKRSGLFPPARLVGRSVREMGRCSAFVNLQFLIIPQIK